MLSTAAVKLHLDWPASGPRTVEDDDSLCGRLDTLEHVHEVLVAVAAQMLGNKDDEIDAVGRGREAMG